MSYKHAILLEYAHRYALKCFIETGTYGGDTTARMSNSNYFESLYTIEEQEDRWVRFNDKMKEKENVHCIHGTSQQRLIEIVQTCPRPALFFLDAHYLGRRGAPERDSRICPVIDELNAIASTYNRHDCVIIDDVHYMSYRHQHGWPTLEEVQTCIHKNFPEHSERTYWNLIRVLPKDILL
jgi:hypothetical protein